MSNGDGGAGARRGLLIRGGDILEAASRVDTVVFDKTGTLTAGKPSVTQVVTLARSQWATPQILAMAAAVERETNHPIAQAIIRHAHGAGAYTPVSPPTYLQGLVNPNLWRVH